MAVVYLPLFPAVVLLLPPVFSLENWRALAADPQIPQALIATLVSTLIAAAGALLLALAVVAALWPGSRWRRLCNHLPWLLAIPHVAFAVSVLLIFAEGGELYRLCSICSPMLDRYGIGLGLTLAVKECAFVLWAIYASLPEKDLAQKVTVLRSLGYGRWQALSWLILPAIAPALGAVMLATIAWTLSVVDVALILGPGNPPTLAVLAWQWLSQGDAQQQAKGMLVCVILLVILELIAVALFLGWRRWRRTIPDVSGERPTPRPLRVGRACALLLPLAGIVSVAVLVLVAGNASGSGAGGRQRQRLPGDGGCEPYAGARLGGACAGNDPALAGVGPAARSLLGLAAAGAPCPAAGGRAVSAGAAAAARRAVDCHPVGASAVGAAVDAAGDAASLAPTRSAPVPDCPHPRLGIA